eukprot:g10837.t1
MAELLVSVLGALGRAREAVESAHNFPTTIQDRLADTQSVLQQLQRDPRQVTRIGISRELNQLNDLASRIQTLVRDHTAAPTDSWCSRVCKSITRCSLHTELEKQLQEIDRDVARVLAAVAAKGPTGAVLPPTLPDMASVPAGAPVLPHSYVERAAVQEVAEGLTNPEEPLTPYSVVGMGGGGKSVLASAVVRKSSVREHFRGGIFWVRVGRGAKNSLFPLLLGLAREIGAAPTDAPHGVPHVLDSLEKIQQHLTAVASTSTSPRLVVLDDVWEREVVDALLPLGLKVLVTTRDRSVLGVSAECVEVGDMTEEDALELLLKTSRTVGQPGDAIRTHMTKVVTLCGRLPLVLAIAGSMPVVQGRGLIAGAWGKLIEELENVATKMDASDQDSNSLNVVLETSFSALTFKKKEAFKRTAVLAPGAVASTEMLLNLWEIEDAGGTREEAESLVSKCLLQDVGGGRYRVHDLVLDFVKIKIKADWEMVKKATALQARFLGRLDVLKDYQHSEHGAGNQGLFVLDALWRSVEMLSGDPELEVASYSTSLGELESCEATVDVASSYSSVGFFFHIQGKYKQAEPLYEKSQAIQEKVLGSEHPDVATSLNNRAGMLESQGKYDEADLLYLRAIEIGEKTLGPDHPDLAARLNNRAGLLKKQGKYGDAEPLYERSQAIREKVLGPEHPDVAQSLNNRALLLESQGKYDEADLLYLRAIEIGEKTLGPDHPDLATRLNNRAGLLESQLSEADPLYQRALAIDEKVYGPDHPEVATDLNNRASLLESQGKLSEADPLYQRALAIDEKVYGPDHPEVATDLNNRAGLLESQGKYDEAEPLYERSQAIREKVLGPEHPDVATSLNNRAGLLENQGKLSEAEPLYKRTQEIFDKSLGRDHPNVAHVLNNWATLLYKQENYNEAIPILERALQIRAKKLGENHPDTVVTRNNLEAVRQKV